MALSQYETAINKSKAEKAEKEKKEKLDKTKPQMEEIETRLDRIRNQEKKHLEYVVTHQSSNDQNLITCTKCGNSISKRADKCPKCNNAVLITCGICSKEIPKSSSECPICGDPHPFDLSITLKQRYTTTCIANEVTDPNNSSHKFSLIWFLFSFDGRIGRKSFWFAYPITLFLGLVFSVALELIEESRNMNGLFVIIILTFLLLWPSLAIQVKRWHDRNKSGNWILLNFIPVFGFVWVIIELGFLKGTEGINVYGADPLSKLPFSPKL